MHRSLNIRRERECKNLKDRDTDNYDPDDKQELLNPIMLEKSSHTLEIVIVVDVDTHLLFELFKFSFVELFSFGHRLPR